MLQIGCQQLNQSVFQLVVLVSEALTLPVRRENNKGNGNGGLFNRFASLLYQLSNPEMKTSLIGPALNVRLHSYNDRIFSDYKKLDLLLNFFL